MTSTLASLSIVSGGRTRVVQVGSRGPIGPQGAQGPQGPPGLGFDVVAKTTSYTVLSGDSGNLITFNGSNKTATLPAAAPAEPWAIGILNLHATPLTVSPNGLQIQGGSSSLTVAQNQCFYVWSDGANYFVGGQLPSSVVLDSQLDGLRLGVGFDVIVLIGQSETGAGNNATPDTVRLDPPDPRVFQYGSLGTFANKISVAIEPLLNNFPTGAGLSPMTAFVERYLRWVAPNRQVLIVPCGVGGTGFSGSPPSWKTTVTGSLLDGAIAQALAALAAAGGNSRFVGAVWVQGQANSGDTQAAYSANLYALIDYLRTALSSPNLPFLISQHDPDWIVNHLPGAANVDAAQVQTPADRFYSAYADTPAGMSIETSNPTHVNAAGQRIRGYRLFDAWLRALSNTPTSLPGQPGAITLVQSGTSLTATWVRSLGNITGYKVELQHNGGAWVDQGHTDLTNVQTATGLTLGDTYAVRVTAQQSALSSTPTVSSTFTMVVVPGQVTGLTAPTPTINEIDASWTAVASATSYLVEYKVHSSGSWLTFGTVASPTVADAITGLLYSTSYDVRVSATDAAGTGAPSTTMMKTTGALVGPYDAIAPASLNTGAFSVCRSLKSTYTGRLIRVRRDSDNAETDIGQVAGILDTASMLAWSGTARVYVRTIYNQLGGPDLDQATQSKQPTIVLAGGVLNTVGPNSSPCAVFDGSTSIMSHSTPGWWAAGATGATFALVASPTAAQKVLFGETRSGSANAFAYVEMGGSGNTRDFLDVTNDAAAAIIHNSGNEIFAGALRAIVGIDSGSAINLYTDNTGSSVYAYTRSGVFTLTRFCVGGGIRTTEELQSPMQFCELTTWAAALGTTDRNTLHANHQAFYGTP